MFGNDNQFLTAVLLSGTVLITGCQAPGRSTTSSARIASQPVRTGSVQASIPTPAPRMAEKVEAPSVESNEPGQFSIPQQPAELQPVREDIVPLPQDLEEPPAQQAAADQGFVAQMSHEVVQGRNLQPIGTGIFNSYRANVAPRTYRPTMNSKPQRMTVPADARPAGKPVQQIDESHRSFVTLGTPEFIIEMQPVSQPVHKKTQLQVKEASHRTVVSQPVPQSSGDELPGWNEIMKPNGKLPASIRPTGIQSQQQMPKVTPAPQQESASSWKSWTNRMLKKSK